MGSKGVPLPQAIEGGQSPSRSSGKERGLWLGKHCVCLVYKSLEIGVRPSLLPELIHWDSVMFVNIGDI